jgi:hypothetical protein
VPSGTVQGRLMIAERGTALGEVDECLELAGAVMLARRLDPSGVRLVGQ